MDKFKNVLEFIQIMSWLVGAPLLLEAVATVLF